MAAIRRFSGYSAGVMKICGTNRITAIDHDRSRFLTMILQIPPSSVMDFSTIPTIYVFPAHAGMNRR